MKTKEKIMDRLERLIDDAMPNDNLFSYDRDVLDSIYNLFYDWISIKDKLPKEGDIVLIYAERGVLVIRYEKGDEIDFTHWMLLPTIPETECKSAGEN